MTWALAREQFLGLRVGARVFALILVSLPILWNGDTDGMLSVLALGCIWLAATAVEQVRFLPTLATIVAEAALVGAACALSLHDNATPVVGALAVPPFTAALRRGSRAVWLSLSAELASLVVVYAFVYGPLQQDAGVASFTWALTGLGLGLIGSFLSTTTPALPDDPLQAYRDAQAHIRELIGLSGELRSGLDPVALAGRISSIVRDRLPVSALAVHVPRGEELTPLLTDAGSTAPGSDVLARAALIDGRIHTSGHDFALPLVTDVGTVAVVAGELSAGLDPEQVGLRGALETISAELEESAVYLDTALLFAALRDAATAEERRRLAREMHDGVAQEIASLGYAVDGLVAEAQSPEQAEELMAVRQRLSSVVGEVRRSVQTLRTEIGESESLGMAIGSLARHLSVSAGLPIHVTLDEGTTRLRTQVESELLRIAQEAMTNAVKHASATAIEVHCTVAPPYAQIIVADDGRGLGPARSDSHGLEIMRERATLIDAELEIGPGRTGGTVVTVRIPTRDGVSSPSWHSPTAKVAP